MRTVLGIERSLSGQPWHWRGSAAEARDLHFSPDDLLSDLLLSRGAPREHLDLHRQPKLRGFMPDPSLFSDMDRAAVRLADAVEYGEAITVFGDYDVDGATSAALLIRLLRMLGRKAEAYIPDRLTEGYGPSTTAMAAIAGRGTRLIVTVDCGATAHAALQTARDAGVDVIVVDHHQCTEELPPAHAVVNPNRLDESDEGRAHGHLAAVGVAFLLGAALLRELRRRGRFQQVDEPRLVDLLDLVALGTVADVAQIRGLNRAFVAQGLRIMARRGNMGLSALIDASRLTRAPACSDLGFALGPRINAGGRVGSATLGVRLLTTDDPDEARAIAAELDRLNEARRAVEAAVQEVAEAQLEGQRGRAVAVLAGEGWHPGVIGIVAGRIKERTGRPAMVIALDEAGVGKGSGRSISGVDLGSAVISARTLGILEAGGGHAMAAGLTVRRERIGDLAAFFEEQLGEAVVGACGARALLVDTLVTPRGLCPDLVETLEAAGPFGVGWPAPRVVAGPVRAVKAELVGNGHVRLIASGADGRSFKAIAFRSAESEFGQTLLHGARDRNLWLAGRPKRDDWGERRAVELHLEDAAFAD